jgi:formyltetrahydrofolate synthetase
VFASTDERPRERSASWLVPLCGDITQMPGLGRSPAALNVDIDAHGKTVGLFSRATIGVRTGSAAA